MSASLMIVAASARAAAASARRAGFDPVAIDQFGDRDLQANCVSHFVADYPRRLIEVALTIPPTRWMYGGAFENHPQIVHAISARHRLLGNPAHVLRAVRDPFAVAEVLEDHGFTCPDLRRLTGAGIDGTWLLKAFRSAAGSGVQFFNGAGSDARPDTHFLQRHVAGTPVSGAFVGNGRDAVLLGATRQIIGQRWTGASGFRYAGSIGPLPLPACLSQRFLAIGRLLAQKFLLRGMFGIDAIVADDEIWPVEINPRYTASVEVLERGTGIRAVDLHVGGCLGGELPAGEIAPPSRVCGKAILFAPHRVSPSKAFERLIDHRDPADGWPVLADIPAPGTIIERGHPIATVLAAGVNVEAVESRLRNIAADVYNRLPAAIGDPAAV